MRVVLSLLAFVAAAQATASELHPADLRLTLMLTPETEPVEASYVFDGGGGGGVTSDSLDPGYRVEIGLVTRITELTPSTALVGGGWVFYGEQESGSSGDLGIMRGPRSYLVFGINLYIALQAQFNRYLGMEIGPVVGAGTTRFSDRMGSGSSAVEETGHGVYEEAGMNLQFLVRNAKRTTVIALGVRYLLSYGEADNAFDGMTQEVEVEQRGFAPFATVGLTF